MAFGSKVINQLNNSGWAAGVQGNSPKTATRVIARLKEFGAIFKSADVVLDTYFSLDNLYRAMVIPALGSVQPNSAASGSNPGFNFAGLATRAAVTTSILNEVLRRKRPSRSIPDWKSNL